MSGKILKKLRQTLIPAPLYHVIRRSDFIKTFRMLFVIGKDYWRIFLYLIRKKRFKDARNFLGVKLYTPVGPGGAGLFWFIFGWFIRLFPLLYKFPRQLELEITTKCSKRCIHCEHTWWNKDSQPRRHMTRDEVIKILEQFPDLRWVSLVGEGGSFEHPEILDFIKYVKDRGIVCYMVDHLSDWTDETIKKVIEYGVDGVEVSFDAATKDTYESLKVGCNFNNVTNNIKKIVQEKKRKHTPIPEIVFVYIAMKKNVYEIPAFVDLIASLGTRKDFGIGSRIGVARLLTFEQIRDLNLEDIPAKVIDEALQRAKKHDLFITFTGTNIRADLPEPTACMAWMEPYIMMGGYISQCCAVFISNNRDFIRKYSHGNVLEKDFVEHWHGKSYRTLRKLVNKPDKPIPIQCAGCRIFNTLPREIKYGIINTHNGKIISLRNFYENYMGENMKFIYKDIIKEL